MKNISLASLALVSVFTVLLTNAQITSATTNPSLGSVCKTNWDWVQKITEQRSEFNPDSTLTSYAVVQSTGASSEFVAFVTDTARISYDNNALTIPANTTRYNFSLSSGEYTSSVTNALPTSFSSVYCAYAVHNADNSGYTGEIPPGYPTPCPQDQTGIYPECVTPPTKANIYARAVGIGVAGIVAIYLIMMFRYKGDS